MAEDTRKIVYYKSLEYYVVEDLGVITKLEEVGKSHIKRTVETSKLMTPAEFQEWRDKQRSTHVNWCK